jgi:two-component sensor histidine kinase
MPPHDPAQTDVDTSLAMAMLASSTAPLALLDGDLNVVALSDTFCRAFEVEGAAVAGHPFLEIGDGGWNKPQLRSLLSVTISGAAEIDAYEMEFTGAGQGPRLLVINARRLAYGDAGNVRMLLTVSDVTEARLSEKLKDDLLREKAILLQEVQHRVANSLQIIASVILQNARRVQSEETRDHLRDAHQRVMSVALLQQQLAASRVGDVALRAYFNDLCKSIGASMIRDHNQIALDVDADDSAVHADVSISLGLIVTELVINALKHAFPDGRKGRIVVGYDAHGPNWTLSISDDGVGMPADPDSAKPGLGTSIVEALANQLRARVELGGVHPGTRVSVVHRQLEAVVDDVAVARPAV